MHPGSPRRFPDKLGGKRLIPSNEIGEISVRIIVRYFASIREATGVKEEEIELPDGCTVETLMREVRELHSTLKSQSGAIIFSVNGEFAETSRSLKPADEVAMFPPVSGG